MSNTSIRILGTAITMASIEAKVQIQKLTAKTKNIIVEISVKVINITFQFVNFL